jgi:hypothetical protein
LYLGRSNAPLFFLRLLLVIIIDTEVYRDYFLVSALHIPSGRVLAFEQYDGQPLNVSAVMGMMAGNTSVGFNSLSFDLPILAAAVAGADCQRLKTMADTIIGTKGSPWQVLRSFDIVIPRTWDHIDLIDVAPGKSSLKIYGGRLHSQRMQDLPIPPDASIAPEQRALLREYCENDLQTTLDLYRALEKQIDLRISMSEQYGMDLRSKSDAQIAEAVIRSEVTKRTGIEYRRPDIKETAVWYRDPGIVQFEDRQLRDIFDSMLAQPFALAANGGIETPDWLAKRNALIAGKEYRLGIGGLHSCESRRAIRRQPGEILQDWDVASYYPSIVLQQRLAPPSMGDDFLKVYQSIVTRRLEAKASGDKVTADTLKIAVNGSFGKLGSKYSALYAPQLFLQVTITGQLCLLMLIEMMERAGVSVVSANTDGIVIHTAESNRDLVDEVTFDWMLRTSFALECSDYDALISRDVNGYLAVRQDGKTKGKGIFGEPSLMKNPDLQIVTHAVAEFGAHGTPIEQTIMASQDIRDFLIVRQVTGGAVWRDQPLGKAVRYYYSLEVGSAECIHYARNGNRVPRSAGAKPLMTLPDTLPGDIDYAAYIEAADKLRAEVGLW